MKRSWVPFVITIMIFCALGAAIYAAVHKSNDSGLSNKNIITKELPSGETNKLAMMASAAAVYCTANKFSSQYCLLADMSMPSGSRRLFVYDLQKKQIVAAGLVAHGRCNQDWLSGRKYGNAIGCGCSSLGRYRIGHAYHGRFGLAYKLYGLDTSNSNAYNRYVVFHSHSCVPENAVEPSPICQSDGCPTVSPAFLKDVAAIIDNSRQSILLWMFE